MLRILFTLNTILALQACNQPGSTSTLPTNAGTQPSLAKTATMDTAYFWKIMDTAFSAGKFDNSIREKAILNQLTQLTPDQIRQFEIIFQQINQEASTWNNMAAQTIMEGGSSDDRFYYFCCWLISLGKQNFDAIQKSPDFLASLDIPNDKNGMPEVDFEELISLSDQAYGVVTGKASADSTFPRDYAQSKGLFFDSNTNVTGTEWDGSDLPRIAPNLFKKYDSKTR